MDSIAQGLSEKERAGKRKQPPAYVWILAALWSIAVSAGFTAIFFWQFHPMESFGYVMIGFVWGMEVSVLIVFYSLFKNAWKANRSNADSSGLLRSGFGEQRVDTKFVGSRR